MDAIAAPNDLSLALNVSYERRGLFSYATTISPPLGADAPHLPRAKFGRMIHAPIINTNTKFETPTLPHTSVPPYRDAPPLAVSHAEGRDHSSAVRLYAAPVETTACYLIDY